MRNAQIASQAKHSHTKGMSRILTIPPGRYSMRSSAVPGVLGPCLRHLMAEDVFQLEAGIIGKPIHMMVIFQQSYAPHGLQMSR